MSKQRLWTRNFTIISVGTLISMLGNAVAGFAMGLLVLDKTESTFLFVLFMVIYFLPKVVLPMIAGPYLDNFSRCKVVYMLDFICAAYFGLLAFIISTGYYNYAVYTVCGAVLGGIDSVYQVAYDSLYPMLIPEGCYSKAYAVSSMIYPLSAVMTPLASIAYDKIGVVALFLFNAATFFIAAVFETQIRVDESQTKRHTGKFRARDFTNEFKSGLRFIYSEKGLLVITLYFTINAFTGGSSQILLPYFTKTPGLSALLYTLVFGGSVIGRLIGGTLHYKIEIPQAWRFWIALMVYVIYSISDGILLFFPVAAMTVLMFIQGILGVTSYNIRIAATQSYVPNAFRGRFNSCFQILTTCGTIVGQLVSGALAEVVNTKLIFVGAAVINLLAVYFVMYRGRDHVKIIYNESLPVTKESAT